MKLLMNLRQSTVFRLILIVGFIVAVIVLGRWMGDKIPVLEAHVASLGVWGPIVLVGLVALATPLFVPDTLFAVAAGALFGLLEGTVIVVSGAFVASCLCFALSRFCLKEGVARLLNKDRRIAAIASAAERQGLKFQWLLRLTPLSPVAVSYALGTSNTRFGTFMVGCLGIIPGIFVEVYFGYVAKHAAAMVGNVGSHSRVHQAVMFAGVGVCIVLIVVVTRIARQALAELDPALERQVE